MATATPSLPPGAADVRCKERKVEVYQHRMMVGERILVRRVWDQIESLFGLVGWLVVFYTSLVPV